MNKIYTIYKVTNTLNGKIYIGFTSNFSSRKRLHKHNALNGKKHIFHNSIRKHGWDNFDWGILYQSKDKEHTLVVMEQYFITEYNSMAPNGYNMKLGGSGGNLSDSARLKISEKRKGMVFSEEHIENLRKSHLGKTLSQEQKDKIGKSNKGKNKGRKNGPLPDAVKLKLSLNLKGIKKGYIKKVRCCCVICHKVISNNHVGIHYKIH